MRIFDQQGSWKIALATKKVPLLRAHFFNLHQNIAMWYAKRKIFLRPSRASNWFFLRHYVILIIKDGRHSSATHQNKLQSTTKQGWEHDSADFLACFWSNHRKKWLIQWRINSTKASKMLNMSYFVEFMRKCVEISKSCRHCFRFTAVVLVAEKCCNSGLECIWDIFKYKLMC